jgi:hypothetical protein
MEVSGPLHASAALPLGKKTGSPEIRGWWAPERVSTYNFNLRGPGYLSRHSDSLRAGRSGDRIQWGRDVPHLSRPALGPIQPPIQWVPALFRGVKRPGPGVDHPPPSSAEVKERADLYLYSPSAL